MTDIQAQALSDRDYEAVDLRTANGCRLELALDFGALTNGLQFSTGERVLDVLKVLPSREALANDKSYSGIPLFPLVNRLDAGRYEHLGEEYQLPLNEPALNNSLHGFLQHLKPAVHVTQGEQSSEATVRYDYAGDWPGYPFPACVDINYRLNNDASLQITISVLNKHVAGIPLGIGWHPYFTLGGQVDDWRMQMPEVLRIPVDDRLLPAGEKVPFENFAQLMPIGDIQLDTCFEIVDTACERVSTLLWSDKTQLGLEIWQQVGQKAYNYIQVCIPPDRRSIAIEPVSCGINAFNNGEGLVILAPGERMIAQMGVRLLTGQNFINSGS